MTTETHQQVGAYKSNQRKNESEREIEAQALLSCASQLDAARASGQRDECTKALKRNQRLWTIFQVALCDPENPLPRELKALLLNLSRYVDRVSFRAIGECKPALLQSLIDINRSIASGLNKKPKTETRASETASAPPPAAMTPAAPSVMTTA